MLRKLSALLLIFVCLMGVVPVFAQDEEAEEGDAYVACSEEELTATVEGLAGYNEALAELGDIASGPADNDYGAMIAAYDSFSYEFWYTIFPEVPACAEAQAYALNVGMIYDEYLTIGLLLNLSAWSDASGDADSAAAFAGSAETRAAKIAEGVSLMEGITAEDLADWVNSEGMESCDEETYNTALTTIGEYFTSIGEAQTALSEDTDANLTALVVSDVAAQSYWNEVYPTISGCYEANYYAWEAGRILDETTIVTGLALNAMVENEGGNTEVAETLIASAQARQEGLAAYAAEVFPTTEEE